MLKKFKRYYLIEIEGMSYLPENYKKTLLEMDVELVMDAMLRAALDTLQSETEPLVIRIGSDEKKEKILKVKLIRRD